MRAILPKGFVAVDGTSLTVCDVDAGGGWFSLMLIPHTQRAIALPRKPLGARVNLEADVLGKYAAAAADAAVGALAARLGVLEAAVAAACAALGARLDALESARARAGATALGSGSGSGALSGVGAQPGVEAGVDTVEPGATAS